MVTALFSMVFLTACDDKVEARNDQPAAEDNEDSTTGGDTTGGGDSATAQTPLPNYDESGLPTTGTYYFHPDHLGSVAYLTDSSGKIVTRMNYTPYGETAGTVEASKNIFSQKFTGQADDGVKTGLLYCNARFYDPVIGRFLSADSIVPGAGNSQAFNRYMYVAGNPVKYRDITGHWWGEGALKKIGQDIAGNITGMTAYENGGFMGYFCRMFTGGFLSYSYEGGYGITAGVPLPGGFTVGLHYQQKGYNGGVSVFVGWGFKNGSFSAGSFISYNINKQYATFGIYAGVDTMSGFNTTGVGYSCTFDGNGNIINRGFYGYSFIHIPEGQRFITSDTEIDGRELEMSHSYYGCEHVTGDEQMGSPIREDRWYMEALDTLALHSTGILHDNMVVAGNINNHNPYWMLQGYAMANLMVGPNQSYPYSYENIWRD